MRQPVPWSSPQPAPVPSILISATQQLAFEGAHGDLTSEYPRLGASGFRVSRVLSAGGELFLTDDPGAILLFASRGGVVVRVGETEGHLGPGEAVFLHSYGRRTLTLRPEQDLFEGRLLMLPLAELHDLARLAGGPALPDAAMVPITGPSARRLADFVAFLLTNLEHRDQS